MPEENKFKTPNLSQFQNVAGKKDLVTIGAQTLGKLVYDITGVVGSTVALETF